MSSPAFAERLIEAGDYPFDGTHTGFRPDPDWQPLRLVNDARFPLHWPT